MSGDNFTDRVLLAGDIRRMEVKWIDGRPAPESRELKQGEKFRDLDAVNELCPQSEWRTLWQDEGAMGAAICH